MTRVTKQWPAEAASHLGKPRNDLVIEAAVAGEPGRFVATEGPFLTYEREVRTNPEGVVEETRYRLAVPWFAWIFSLPVRRAIGRPPNAHRHSGRRPWWAPPDVLDARASTVVGLLAAASVVVGYVNTLFTQTVSFAAKDFGISNSTMGDAGGVVRAGIVLVLPLLFLADRRGRRKIMIWCAVGATICSALGALAPSFWALTGSQAVGRSLGLALDVIITVVAAEEMPRNSRAYAVSVLAMATGLGSGLCVMALGLADLGPGGWRLVYLPPLILLIVAADLARRLPESKRFDIAAVRSGPRVSRRRLAIIASTAFAVNLFLAPASYFQNRYLGDIRGYSGFEITLFTISTATPAGIGLLIGGRLADVHGRRGVGVVSLVISAALLSSSFAIGGWAMWVLAFLGGFIAGAAAPALQVYRTELFPTRGRTGAGGLITTSALVAGIGSLWLTGRLLDRGVSYGAIMAGLAIGPMLAAALIWRTYPETAHRELEELS